MIAKLIKHLHDTLPNLSFRELVEQVILQLVRYPLYRFRSSIYINSLSPSQKQEGAFALAFKSTKYPGQLVATRRGSPLLVGIKTKTNLVSNHIPIIFGTTKGMILYTIIRFVFCLVAVLGMMCSNAISADLSPSLPYVPVNATRSSCSPRTPSLRNHCHVSTLHPTCITSSSSTDTPAITNGGIDLK